MFEFWAFTLFAGMGTSLVLILTGAAPPFHVTLTPQHIMENVAAVFALLQAAKND